MLSEEKLTLELNRLGLKDCTVIYKETTGSTNEDAKALAMHKDRMSVCASCTDKKAVVVADNQTAGRGRRGRSWETEQGCSVAMSLLLYPDIKPENASMLTLVMALSVADAVKDMLIRAESLDNNVTIKWPNDILLNRRKVCGILTEMSINEGKIAYVVIGVGVNVNETKFPDEISAIATSLYQETGTFFDREDIIVSVIENFEKYYAVFHKQESLQELKALYEDRLINKGEKVRVLDPKGEYEGQALGINDTGELLVRREDGEVIPIYAGEVSVRGVYGYA